jgi:hypothetical protein
MERKRERRKERKEKKKKGIEINKANPPGPVQYGNGFNPPEVSHTLTVCLCPKLSLLAQFCMLTLTDEARSTFSSTFSSIAVLVSS